MLSIGDEVEVIDPTLKSFGNRGVIERAQCPNIHLMKEHIHNGGSWVVDFNGKKIGISDSKLKRLTPFKDNPSLYKEGEYVVVHGVLSEQYAIVENSNPIPEQPGRGWRLVSAVGITDPLIVHVNHLKPVDEKDIGDCKNELSRHFDMKREREKDSKSYVIVIAGSDDIVGSKMSFTTKGSRLKEHIKKIIFKYQLNFKDIVVYELGERKDIDISFDVSIKD